MLTAVMLSAVAVAAAMAPTGVIVAVVTAVTAAAVAVAVPGCPWGWVLHGGHYPATALGRPAPRRRRRRRGASTPRVPDEENVWAGAAANVGGSPYNQPLLCVAHPTHPLYLSARVWSLPTTSSFPINLPYLRLSRLSRRRPRVTVDPKHGQANEEGLPEGQSPQGSPSESTPEVSFP